jgi:DNA ligase (NAD+)
MPNIVFNFADAVQYPVGDFTIKEFLELNNVEVTRDNQVQCQKKFNKSADTGEMMKGKRGNQSTYKVVDMPVDAVLAQVKVPKEKNDTEKARLVKEVIADGSYEEKVALANQATEAYHDGGNSPLTDSEYDKLEESIEAEEKATGVVAADSPTQNVGSPVSASHLTKVSHGELPMMSLAKTKDVNEINRIAGGNNNYVAMPKFDGCAIRLKYDKDGNFYQAVTRGNGKEGADVTIHARKFGRMYVDGQETPALGHVPLRIPEWQPKDGQELWIDGEAMIIQSNAAAARATATSDDKKKSLRNLTSGMLKRLENTHSHLISFFPYRVRQGSYAPDLWGDLVRLKSRGFNVYAKKSLLTGGVTSETQEQLETYAKHFEDLGIGIDGLVFVYANYEMAAQMGTTSKFPKHSIAFKFRDEEEETIVESIDLQIGVHGGATPCVNFKTVELEDTEVSRATLNNVPFYQKLNFGIGDKIVVRKANQIIPQVVKALTHGGDRPTFEDCPECGTKLQSVFTDGVETDRICTNYDCPARVKARLLALVGVSGLDVKGIGVKMIEQLYENANIRSQSGLIGYLGDSQAMSHSETSQKVHAEAMAKFSNAKLDALLVGMCIPSVGASLASDIAAGANEVTAVTEYDSVRDFIFSAKFESLDGVGETIVGTVRKWFDEHGGDLDHVMAVGHDTPLLKFPAPADKVEIPADAPTVVITGTFEVSRAEMTKQLGELGFRVQGAVNKQTQYLLAGDNTGAVKISKASKLGVAVVDSVDRLLELSGK